MGLSRTSCGLPGACASWVPPGPRFPLKPFSGGQVLLAALKLLPQGRGPSSHHLRSPLGQGRARGASLLSNELSPPNGRRPPPLTREPLANIRRVKPSVGSWTAPEPHCTSTPPAAFVKREIAGPTWVSDLGGLGQGLGTCVSSLFQAMLMLRTLTPWFTCHLAWVLPEADSDT